MTIQQDLARACFVVNKAKCKWTPSYKCTWLLFDIDLSLLICINEETKNVWSFTITK